MKANQGPWVLVTGCSTGIGYAAAKALTLRGTRVFAGVRDPSDGLRLREALGDHLLPVLLDVTQSDQIESAFNQVAEHTDSLHGLVNNAGIGVAGPLECLGLDRFRLQLEVNLVGALAVTQAALPYLRRGPGRIVNVSSVSGTVAFPFLGPYAASKFALEALSDALRMELKPFGIEVAIIAPGPIETPIWEKSRKASEQHFAGDTQHPRLQDYAKGLETFERKVQGLAARAIPAEVVAESVVHALYAKRPRTRYRMGPGSKLNVWVRRLLPDRVLDGLIGRGLDWR